MRLFATAVVIRTKAGAPFPESMTPATAPFFFAHHHPPLKKFLKNFQK
jgi:hypothetical protein